MGVSDGSPVDAATTNPAFLDATNDDTGTGQYTLANTLLASGPTIVNIQALQNANRIATGADETDFTVGVDYTSAPTSTITTGTSHKAALIALAQKFDPTTGHKHKAIAGDGPQIDYIDLLGPQLVGYLVTGTFLSTVSGGTWDVSTELTGGTPSTSPTVKGIVVNAPYNYVSLFDANDDSFLDGSGNKVYARLTEAATVWTLTFYSDVGGTETPYTFSSTPTVKWLYQQLYDETDRPVYSDLLIRTSDQVAGDIPDATTSIKGKVLLATATPQSVASANAVGSGPRVAMEDHAHQGVHSIKKSGDTALYGDVTLSAGAGIVLTEAGQDIQIAAVAQGFTRSKVVGFTLADNQPTPQLIAAYDKATTKSLLITYHTDRGTANYKTSTFIINVNSNATANQYLDEGQEVGTTGFTLSADVAGGAGVEIQFLYTSTNTGTAGTITFESTIIA